MTTAFPARLRSLARPNVLNSICLALIVALLAAPFLSRLGFYCDDWSLLSDFQSDLADGHFGLQTMLRGYEPRPLQGIYLASLFYVFGLDPLPHHLVNTTVLAAAIVAFYSLLVRMEMQRTLAFAAAVTLAVLPQLSTARVWYATFQIPLALLLALVSLHAQLSFVKGGRAWLLVLAATCAIASMAGYEIFAPFIIGFPLWLAIESRLAKHPALSESRCTGLAIAAIALVALGVAAKSVVTNRAQAPDLAMYLEGLRRLAKPSYDWRIEGSLNVFASADVNLWQPFVGMARSTAAVLQGDLGLAAVLAGIAVGVISLWRLSAVDAADERRRGAAWAIAIGVAVFLLGHATFLINSQIMFSPTGIGNRALVAAGVGVALLVVGLTGFAAARLSPRHGRLLFAAAMTVIVLTSAWRTGQIYSYWAESWSIERRLVASVRADLKRLPAHSIVIFDGVCPYHGPGIVLESVEAGDMLSLVLDRPMTGDTVSERMRLGRNGLVASIYEEESFYPFGGSLYLYDPGRRLVVPIPDRAAALRYFASPGRRRDCPVGYVGQGELI